MSNTHPKRAPVHVERINDVLQLSIDSPANRNSIATPGVLEGLLSCIEQLERDTVRLKASYASTNRNPLGACAITGCHGRSGNCQVPSANTPTKIGRAHV